MKVDSMQKVYSTKIGAGYFYVEEKTQNKIVARKRN